jgi:hypothetical protein
VSTILKALRRLEEERHAQSRRPLREEVASGVEAPRSTRRRGPWLAAALALGIAAGVIAFWQTNREAPPPELASAPPPQAAPPVAAPAWEPPAEVPAPPPLPPSEAAALEPEPEPGELSPAALASKVEFMKRPPAGPRIADADATAAAAGQDRLRRTPPPRKVDPALLPGRHRRAMPAEDPSRTQLAVLEAHEAPLRAPSAPEPPERRPASTPAPREPTPPPPQAQTPPSQPPAPSSTEPEAVPVAEPEVAPIAEPEAAPVSTSAGARSEIPGLRVQRTVWHPVAERRIAVVELDGGDGPREIHEGDAVGPLVVSEIEPSGVVFLHEGIELRHRVGD